jgi:NADH-quinone oxidoreductase subunit G
MLLDNGRLQDGEPYLAGTARPAVVRLSAATAAGSARPRGDLVSVSSGARGHLPLVITEMPDGVAWLPLNSPGSAVHEQLAVTTGAVVQIEREAGRELSGPDGVRHDPWWLILIKAVASSCSCC